MYPQGGPTTQGYILTTVYHQGLTMKEKVQCDLPRIQIDIWKERPQKRDASEFDGKGL